MIFIIIYICSYVYLCIYTPLYQHFKAFFCVSKFNSETSFLYQLFKENSNFIVLKLGKMFIYVYMYLCIYVSYIYLCINIYRYTPSTKQAIQGNFKVYFHVIIYISSHLYLYIYTPSYQHFKAFFVCLNSILRQVFCINFSRRIQI